MRHFNTEKTKTVSARVTESDAQLIKEIAEKDFNGKTGTLFRVALEEFLENYSPNS